MSDKIELLKTLGFSEELLKYFQEHTEEQPVITAPDFDPVIFENFDVTNIPNINQMELATTTFTFNSENH